MKSGCSFAYFKQTSPHFQIRYSYIKVVFLVTEGLCKHTSGVSACTLMDECLARMNCAAAGSVINAAVFADDVNDVWSGECDPLRPCSRPMSQG